ncbi:MAG TPA: excinuclease ABC subunit UvrC [Acidimicrobiales bacterium]|nr:excinuclease ABC subunit UvrC [Acidimicrobiales bacterium]
MQVRPAPGSIPDAPGSYQFLDAGGRVLYVGKAKSLRSRLANYFVEPATLPPRTAQMVALADRVEWMQVANEVEAILLEYALIKRHRPRFNIRLVDDKSYPSLAVTLADEWPRAAVVRGRHRPGVRYFGPYAHVGAIRDTLDLLLRTFQVRTCSDAKLERHVKLGRPCLLFHIERCSGPCIGAVERPRYDQMVDDLMAFLAGDTEDVERRLEAEMEGAAAELDFERAARLRDRLRTLRLACERQQVVTDRPEDLDVVGIEDDPLEAAVCVFHVRRGRVVGRRAFVVDKVEELTRPQLLGRVLEELYADAVPDPAPERRSGRVRGADASGWTSGAGDPSTWGTEGPAAPGVPRQVLVPELPDEPALYEAFLGDRRGGAVALRVPRRGGKRALLETVTRNAGEELARHRLRRASDHASRARALEALQHALGLPHAPLRIECYDMSHLQGTDYVGSMVVLEDGLPRKSEYRRFRIRDVPGNDDYAAMEEVLTRRLSALLAARDQTRGEEASAGSARARRFAYPPQLLLLDGGKGQLGVGVRVLERLGLAGEIPVAALAKSFEEVFVPGRPDPVVIPRGSEALFLLQRVRDEAHRFAITYHRQLRGRRMRASSLEGVAGLGPTRRTRLVKELGSVKAVRQASLDELRALPWLPDPVAEAVYAHLHPYGPGPGRPGVPGARPAPAPGDRTPGDPNPGDPNPGGPTPGDPTPGEAGAAPAPTGGPEPAPVPR